MPVEALDRFAELDLRARLALGLAYAGASVALTRAVTVLRAWRVFFVSIVYLPALLTLMVLDKVVA